MALLDTFPSHSGQVINAMISSPLSLKMGTKNTPIQVQEICDIIYLFRIVISVSDLYSIYISRSVLVAPGGFIISTILLRSTKRSFGAVSNRM